MYHSGGHSVCWTAVMPHYVMMSVKVLFKLFDILASLCSHGEIF